jgi:hypothetical protein
MQLANELELQTGDILLFRGDSLLSKVLEFVGRSKYSHVGIILKNPSFINPNLEDGIYLWDSSWGYSPDSEDNTYHYGIQLHKLDDIISLYPKNSIYVRKVNAVRDEAFYEKLKAIHDIVYRKPYDLHIMDWIESLENMYKKVEINSVWKTTQRFWCSAFVSFVYYKLGWISDVNWTLIAPREFSTIDSTGQLLFICVLEDEKLIF